MTNNTTDHFEFPDGAEIPDFTPNFSFFPGTDGVDTPRLAFPDANFAVASLADGTATTGDGLRSDDAADRVTVNGTNLLDTTGLPPGVEGRSGVILGFGPQDTLTFEGISGNEAEVFLFSNERVADVPDDFLVGGAVIAFPGAGAIVVADDGREPFSGQDDFNDRVTFENGGTPRFNTAPALNEIFDEFERSGELPAAEVPGVFELPNEPRPGDTIDLPPVTITIGGEEVTFDPGDPFWFDDIPAEAREELLADPEIAVGYDYRLVEPADGQAFATIRAPRVGEDTAYNLVVFDPDGTARPARDITAATEVNFETLYDFPVTNFILEGIDTSANLAPDDPRAFPLAVSFTQAGPVDMQQTPLVRGFEFRGDSPEDVKGTAAAFYVGYYGRTADPAGFEFWTGQVEQRVDNEIPIFDIARDLAVRFGDAEETKALYPFLDRAGSTDVTQSQAAGFISDVYQNLFDRAPEQAGLEFWSEQVVERISGGESVADIIITIMDSAGDDDAVTVGNKIDVAAAYGDAFTQDQFDAPGDVPDPNAILDAVGSTDASVQSALQQIAAAGGTVADEVATVAQAAPGDDPLVT